MLNERSFLKGLLGRISIMTSAVSVVCILLMVLSAHNRPDEISTLSRQDMTRIVGGATCTECDDCHTISDSILECDHFNPPAPHFCDTTGCLNNILLTKGCSHSQGPGAEGC